MFAIIDDKYYLCVPKGRVGSLDCSNRKWQTFQFPQFPAQIIVRLHND